jgi:hypothetical protein
LVKKATMDQLPVEEDPSFGHPLSLSLCIHLSNSTTVGKLEFQLSEPKLLLKMIDHLQFATDIDSQICHRY